MRSSISRVMNLTEIAQIRKEPVVFYFLDGAKAFDRIEWGGLVEKNGIWARLFALDQNNLQQTGSKYLDRRV